MLCFDLEGGLSSLLGVEPTFEQDVAVVLPDGWTTVIRTEVGEEVWSSTGECFECSPDLIRWIRTLTAVVPGDNDLVILFEDASDVGVIESRESPAYIGTRINESLRLI